MNISVKYIILAIISVDSLILLLVKENCGPIIYSLMIESLSMQVFSLLCSIDSKFSRVITNMFNINLMKMKVGAFFVILISFYLIFLARQGITFQNPIRGCV